MPAESPTVRRSIVMLTADRSIDRRILLQANTLRDAGWQVTIIAMPADAPVDEPDWVVRLDGDANHVSRRERYVVQLYKWLRKYVPMNGRLMAKFKTVTWRHLLDQEAFFIKLFLPVALNYKPDVFMAHDLPMLAVAKAAAQETGAKLVYDSHELYCEQEFSADVKLKWSSVERKHIGSCEAVITVNPSIAQELQKRYELPYVHVVYNADSYACLSGRTRYFHQLYDLDSDDKVLLFQGGVTAGRNIENLAYSIALVDNEAVHLVILGDGALVNSLRRSIGSKLSSRVHFHAAVPQTRLLELTAAADAGVIPYQATCLNNYYCTPNKLFEFIACGIPILGSDLPEIRRLVISNEIGRVADLSNPEKIAAAIDIFFEDEKMLSVWRTNLQHAAKTINWNVEGTKIVSIFDRLYGGE